MRPSSFLNLAPFVGFMLFLSAVPAHASETAVIGEACSSLGVTTMATDQKNLIACLKNDSGALVWKAMTSTLGTSTTLQPAFRTYGAGIVLPEWSEHASTITCPSGSVMTGVTLNTAGTCLGSCAGDGPIIQSVGIVCSALK